MIRQAISCDICGNEKKQTNHWFLATDQGGELRVAGWNSRNRLRPGTKHLCGQICLHKLVDLFISRSIAVRARAGATEEIPLKQQVQDADAGVVLVDANAEVESSTRLVVPEAPVSPKRPPLRASTELVAMPGKPQGSEPAPQDEAPRDASRNRRAEAWDRERDRELRAAERRPDIGVRRRSSS